MKVICINNKANSHPDAIGKWMPKEGNKYTVIDTVNWYGLEWYILKEDKGGNGWNPRYFIPVDENKFDTQLRAVLSVPKMTKSKQLTTYDRDGY